MDLIDNTQFLSGLVSYFFRFPTSWPILGLSRFREIKNWFIILYRIKITGKLVKTDDPTAVCSLHKLSAWQINSILPALYIGMECIWLSSNLFANRKKRCRKNSYRFWISQFLHVSVHIEMALFFTYWTSPENLLNECLFVSNSHFSYYPHRAIKSKFSFLMWWNYSFLSEVENR